MDVLHIDVSVEISSQVFRLSSLNKTRTLEMFASRHAVKGRPGRGECPQIREWSRRDLTSPSRTGPAPRVIIRDRPGSYCSSISNCPTAILNLQSTDVKIN
ncbi:hypothetical protein ElyMa_003008400, partial [Elysia marginata]